MYFLSKDLVPSRKWCAYQSFGCVSSFPYSRTKANITRLTECWTGEVQGMLSEWEFTTVPESHCEMQIISTIPWNNINRNVTRTHIADWEIIDFICVHPVSISLFVYVSNVKVKRKHQIKYRILRVVAFS